MACRPLAGGDYQVHTSLAEAEQSGAPFPERLAAMLYAYGGTALEWLGDARHIAELRVVANDVPDIAGALVGAKQGDNVSLDLYRQRLTAIAALANAALSKS